MREHLYLGGVDFFSFFLRERKWGEGKEEIEKQTTH